MKSIAILKILDKGGGGIERAGLWEMKFSEAVSDRSSRSSNRRGSSARGRKQKLGVLGR